LTRVGGRTLIDLVIEGLVDAGTDRITCIVNEQSRAVCEHVERAWPSLAMDWIVRTTPTSMHSFLAVLERLAEAGESQCLLTTVDSVCPRGTTREFARRAAELSAPLALGVTDVIDDEKPLYAVPAVEAVDSRPFQLARLSSDAGASRFVTAGFYWASTAILSEKEHALSSGFTALRQFLGRVVAAGYPCWGVPLASVVDVDRPQDVAVAERLVS
jgi:NDP-sugar pyrophosphorylase family protein